MNYILSVPLDRQAPFPPEVVEVVKMHYSTTFSLHFSSKDICTIIMHRLLLSAFYNLHRLTMN